MTYAEKLKDPRWQKRRLQIFQRDNWCCVYCGCAVKELQVHHVAYTLGLDPWEYEDQYLVTACCDCHADETRLKDDDKFLIAALSIAGIRRRDMYSLAAELRRFIRESGVPHLQFQRLMEFLYAND